MTGTWWCELAWLGGETVAERVFDQFASDFYPLDRSADIFTWDPV